MADRNAFRRAIRDLHGDAEIIEMGPDDQPVRRYVVVKPEKPPTLTGFLLALAALPFLILALLVGLGMIAFGLFMAWLFFWPK